MMTQLKVYWWKDGGIWWYNEKGFLCTRDSDITPRLRELLRLGYTEISLKSAVEAHLVQ